MKNKWVKNRKKIYHIFIPVILILIIVCESIGYQFVAEKEQIKPIYGLEGMERPHNLESIGTPHDALQYVLDAVKGNDVDKFIRGCSVLEQGYGVEYEEFLEKQYELAFEEYVPSGNWLYYFPLMHTNLTQEAVEMYLALADMLENMTVKRIEYKDIDIQLSDEYVLQMSNVCNLWRATSLCEMIALFEDNDGRLFQKTFQIVNYSGQWKLMLSTANREDAIKETTVNEYTELVSDKSDIVQYEELYQISESENIDESALLPCNYFCFEERGEESVEKLIEEFISTIKKGEFEELLTLFYNEGKSAEEKIINKGERAKEIIGLLYKVMGIEKTGKIELSSSFVEQMNPENMRYLRGVIETQHNNNDDQEVVVSLKVNGKQTRVSMSLINTEKGWMISSMKLE